MKQIKNIKYTYCLGGGGPYQGTCSGYTPAQSSYKSIEEMLQKTHPDYYNICVTDYDVVDE